MYFHKIISLSKIDSGYIISAHLRSPPVLRNRKLNDRAGQSVCSGHDRQAHNSNALFKCLTLFKRQLWKAYERRLGGVRYVFFPSWAAGVTILALVYVNSPVERAGEGRRGHIKRGFYTAKWKKFQLCFWRLSEGLGVFWVLLRSWRKAKWCGCGIGASFDDMGAEENGGILHNWKVKSTLAGMT